MRRLLLGADGFDAPHGGCTTHFLVFLLKHLKESFDEGLTLLSPPNLVRLNPFIPWKTRGNASVSVELYVEDSVTVDSLWSAILRFAEAYAESLQQEPKGGLVLIEEPTKQQEQDLVKVYTKALVDVSTFRFIPDSLLPESARNVRIWGTQGVLGALAGLGFIFHSHPVTYELVLYRDLSRVGERREVDESSIRLLELKFRGTIFNNYDWRRERAVAIPRGPDPVLVGIRGTDLDVLCSCRDLVRVYERVSAWAIFRSNQHTDVHGVRRKVGTLKPYQAGTIEGVVSSRPEVEVGGHVSHALTDDTGTITVHYYAPTKPMATIASKLLVGDYIRVLGGAVPHRVEGLVFNAQKLWVLKLAPKASILNPRCPNCGKRLKSLGSKGGYKCLKCGYKTGESLPKEIVKSSREVQAGVYTPGPGRIGHLVKPEPLTLSPRANGDSGIAACSEYFG
uniref:tRNA(Ile2) 2-agmatinylcytidine synthetase TiaS n=1 Tax=Fervidicoccus fontis TaxID=683846 RepID=A0A7J3ZK94_9CREN